MADLLHHPVACINCANLAASALRSFPSSRPHELPSKSHAMNCGCFSGKASIPQTPFCSSRRDVDMISHSTFLSSLILQPASHSHSVPSFPVPKPLLEATTQHATMRGRITMLHKPTTPAAPAAKSAGAATGASTGAASSSSPAAPTAAASTATGGKPNVTAGAVATGSRSATLRTTTPNRTTSSPPSSSSSSPTIAFPNLQSPYFPFEDADFLDAFETAASRHIELRDEAPRQPSIDERAAALRGASSKLPDPAVAADGTYDLSVAERAVQLSCRLTKKVQAQLRREAEDVTRSKPDKSYVTVADWGVQAVVSWVLKQAYPGEVVSMIAEEDTKQLTNDAGSAILARLVSVVNECLAEARLVGIEPPERPLEAPEVLDLINRGSSEGGAVGRHWILDPVDGTLGFVRDDQYAVALALLDLGSLKLGVLGCPNFPVRPEWLRHPHRFHRITSKLFPSCDWREGVVLKALRGHGAFVEPLVGGDPAAVAAADVRRTECGSSRISSSSGGRNGVSSRRVKLDPSWRATSTSNCHVSDVCEPCCATFCEPVEKANSNQTFTAGLADLLGISNAPLRVYSMAKYAAIARGDADIFMKFARNGYQEKVWDHAAGVVIVEEAGGVVTDAGGKPLDFTRGRFLSSLDRGIVASSSLELHQQLLTAIDASWQVYHGGEFTPQDTNTLLMLQQQDLIQVDVPCGNSARPFEGPNQELLWLRRQKLFPLPAAACDLPSQNGMHGGNAEQEDNNADLGCC